MLALEALNLGRQAAWEPRNKQRAGLRLVIENPLISEKLLGGSCGFTPSHERSVAAYLQLTYFHAEELNENQKFTAWQQMGLSYEALGRIRFQ